MRKFLFALFAVMLALLVSCKQNVDDQDDDDGIDGTTPSYEEDRAKAVRAYLDDVVGTWIIMEESSPSQSPFDDDRDRNTFEEDRFVFLDAVYGLDVERDIFDAGSFEEEFDKPARDYFTSEPFLIIASRHFSSLELAYVLCFSRMSNPDKMMVEGTEGRWVLTRESAAGGGAGGDARGEWRYNGNTLTFNADGTFNYSGRYGSSPHSGRWSTSGSVLTVSCTHDNPSIGDVEEEFDYSVDDGGMTLSLRGGNAVSLVLNMFFGVTGTGVTLTR